jgi:hypothetical protein
MASDVELEPEPEKVISTRPVTAGVILQVDPNPIITPVVLVVPAGAVGLASRTLPPIHATVHAVVQVAPDEKLIPAPAVSVVTVPVPLTVAHDGTPDAVSCRTCVPELLPASATHALPFQ